MSRMNADRKSIFIKQYDDVFLFPRSAWECCPRRSASSELRSASLARKAWEPVRRRKARDSNPHAPCGAHWLATRPGEPYPATFLTIRGQPGSRTPISPLQAGYLPVGPAARLFMKRHEPSSWRESNPHRPDVSREPCHWTTGRDEERERESHEWESNPQNHLALDQAAMPIRVPCDHEKPKVPGPGIEPGNPTL